MTYPGPTTSSTRLAELVTELDTAYPGGQRLSPLREMRDLIEREIAAEVRTMTRRHATWADVGRVLGMSRQAAWERWH